MCPTFIMYLRSQLSWPRDVERFGSIHVERFPMLNCTAFAAFLHFPTLCLFVSEKRRNECNSGPSSMCRCLRCWKRQSEVVRLVPHGRVQWIDERIVEVRVPQITEDSVEVFKIVPQEQFSERICEQIVGVSIPPVDAQDELQRLKDRRRNSQKCVSWWPG